MRRLVAAWSTRSFCGLAARTSERPSPRVRRASPTLTTTSPTLHPRDFRQAPAVSLFRSFVGSVERQFLVHVINVENTVLEKARSEERQLAGVGDYSSGHGANPPM